MGIRDDWDVDGVSEWNEELFDIGVYANEDGETVCCCEDAVANVLKGNMAEMAGILTRMVESM